MERDHDVLELKPFKQIWKYELDSAKDTIKEILKTKNDNRLPEFWHN